MEILVIGVIFWGCMIGLGGYVSSEKGRDSTEGVMLALLFGPFGVLIAALLPSKPKATPTQAEVDSGARAAVEKISARIEAEAQADREAVKRWREEKARREADSLEFLTSKGIKPGPFAMFELASVMILDWFRGLSDLGQLGVICLGVASAVGAVAVVAFRSMSR